MRPPWTLALALAVSTLTDTALAQSAAPAAPAPWEGALGLVVRHSPNYLGASSGAWHVNPGLFLRYGRFSVTTNSGFATRHNDEVERGVAAELVRTDRLLLRLSARLDGGRDAGLDPALTGLPDLRATVRARLSAVQLLGSGWRVSAGLSPALLGRGGGITADAGIPPEARVAPGVVASVGLAATWADRRYHQSYFGITPAQSLSSGLRVYTPAAGLRDLGLSAGLRIDLGPHWIAFAGAGASRLQGPALDSPLTRRRDNWSTNGGLAWRF